VWNVDCLANPSILLPVRLMACVVAALIGGLLPPLPVARAANPADARFRLDPLQPASPQSPFFTVEGPLDRDESHDRIALELLATYTRAPLTVYVDDAGSKRKVATPVESLLVAHLLAGWRASPAISLDVDLPMVAAQTGRDAVVGSQRVEAPHGAALGDARVGAIWHAWLGKTIGWSSGLRAWAPTGSRDAYASDGRWRAELLASATAHMRRLQLGCTASAAPSFLLSPAAGDRVALGCAGEYLTIDAGPWIGAEGSLAALRIGRDIAAGSEAELWATVHLAAGPLRMGLAAGPGFGSSPGTPMLRALATFAFVPASATSHTTAPPAAPIDPDLDGIVGTADACPDEAGPASPIAAFNGCPSKDSDGDRIEDRLDDCPLQPGMASDIAGSNGCPDRDSDHIADRMDACPDEPGRTAPSLLANGCPRRARLHGDHFEVDPPLTATSSTPDPRADDDALWEIAAALRASPRLRKIAVEVRLPSPADDQIESTADRAVQIADDIVQRLVDLGVERSRLDPVGAIADDPGIAIRVVETSPADRPR